MKKVTLSFLSVALAFAFSLVSCNKNNDSDVKFQNHEQTFRFRDSVNLKISGQVASVSADNDFYALPQVTKNGGVVLKAKHVGETNITAVGKNGSKTTCHATIKPLFEKVRIISPDFSLTKEEVKNMFKNVEERDNEKLLVIDDPYKFVYLFENDKLQAVGQVIDFASYVEVGAHLYEYGDLLDADPETGMITFESPQYTYVLNKSKDGSMMIIYMPNTKKSKSLSSEKSAIKSIKNKMNELKLRYSRYQ